MALDRDTVVRLLLRERAKVLAYTYAIVRDHQAAEDVFQDVSVLAIDRAPEIEGERHFLGWVRNAARFKALKARRQRRGQPVALEDEVLDLLDGTWQRYDEVPAREMIDALRGCLDRLTPNARQLVELKYVDGLGGALIASRLGRQVRSIYTALSRIHRALSECLAGRALAEGLFDG
jgi:RNA polymerase sigma-70 factor (ECF subfamily)